ncbi:MAG TPA: lysoplasmalogenase family protein [Croceibacterium sp.]|nr:lysoplasmalogenase family protein [Croceibacterium sp.]
MARQALIEKRPLLAASIAAAIVFCALRLTRVPELWFIPLPGAATGFLALYALFQKGGRDGRHLAAMMAVAAVRDVVLQFDLAISALLFFIYQMLAMSLYLRHPRQRTTGTQMAAAVAMLLLTPVVVWLLPADRTIAMPVALYGLALGGMASCAWMSAFPRYRVGIGAALILASDLLVIAGIGPLMGQQLPEALAWPLYYVGQLLITVGVVQTLRRGNPAA